MDIVKTAKSFTSGGKVSVSEARYLASDYLKKVETIEKLTRKISELQGGETITLKSDLYAKEVFDPSNVRVNSFRRANGKSGAFESALLSEIDRLLSGNVVRETIGSLCVMTGPLEHLKKFIRVNEIITCLLQSAYNEGHKDGRNLLFGLAEGTLSVKDFDAMDKHAV